MVSSVPPPEEAGEQVVTALSRGLDILTCFDRPHLQLTVSEIARRTGLSQPTAFRLCRTLLSKGFLVREGAGARLRPGAPALTLGYVAVAGLDPPAIAMPHLQVSAARLRTSLSLSVSRGLEVICLARAGTEYALETEPIGWRAPLASVASGVAILGCMEEPELATTLDALRRAKPDAWPRRKKRIDEARAEIVREGYTFLDHMLEGRYAAAAIALPHDSGHNGQEWWAISSGASTASWSADRRREVGAELLQVKKLLGPAFDVR